MITIEKADRIKNLPPYLFAKIDVMKSEMQKKGADLIDLGIGDPDLPTPGHIIAALEQAARDPKNHRYPSYSGMMEFREAVSHWYQQRFGVKLNPASEVIALIGSKEGIAHIPLAFINPRDIVLVPDPGYPVYNTATLFAGGQPYFMPLLKENNFLPDFAAIPREVAQGAKLMYLNYPNNPTAAVADRTFYEDAVAFARRHQIILCHDAAYTELCFDGYRPCSILEIPGAKEVAVEFHSLSKTYNMTGWRIGFAVGNKEAIDGLSGIKSNVDSGVFQAVQFAGITALRSDQSCVQKMIGIYTERRDLMVSHLKKAGFELDTPKASFYLWIRTPKGYSSAQLATRLLEKGVVVTPGNGFGEPGEGYFRIALTQKKERLEEAMLRIKTVSF